MNRNILTHSKKSLIDIIIGGSIILLLLGSQSCSNSDEVIDENIDQKIQANMQLKFSAADFAANASLYVFNTSNQFLYKQLNVNQSGNELSTNMLVGNWNLVLLSSNNATDITDKIVLPAYNGAMSTAKMWETPLLTGGQFLSQAPEELRRASMANTQINANSTTTLTDVKLDRCVGKVRIILDQYSGFDPVAAGTSTNAYVELLNVPTTLSWEGKLLPNKTTPTVSTKPLRSYWKFDSAGKADTVNFIVPAHMGSDAYTAVGIPTDTSTYKITLNACMILGGSPFFGKGPIVVPFVPKPNRIVEVKLNFRGEPDALLDIKTTVKEWEDEIIQNEEF